MTAKSNDTYDLGPARELDRSLTAIERELELLLNITPTNTAEAWSDFQRSGFSHPPILQTRPLSFEPDLVKRQLFNLEIERVEDPGLFNLLKEKRDELVREIMLLEDRDTSRFLYGSLQLFGEVSDALVAGALELIDAIDVTAPESASVTATAFAERAEEELNFYRERYPGFSAELEIRPDVPDLMVSHGRFLIGASASFRSDRVDPLIQHEIGTHVVTYENGKAQPLGLFSVGLPGYEETQEGLAVLAEFATSGLDPRRLRLLAGRVVAAKLVIDGAQFLDIFDALHQKYSFPAKVAWSVTIRVARSGGLTKDVIYLRGISRVLEFLSERKRLEPLFLGKMALDQIPLIEDLVDRGILRPAQIRPAWLDLPGAAERLERVYGGLHVMDLVGAAEAT